MITWQRKLFAGPYTEGGAVSRGGDATIAAAAVVECCELWKGLAAALTWPGKETHAAKVG